MVDQAATRSPAGQSIIPSSTRRHLTLAEVCDELGISRSTFYDWRSARKGPRCIKLPNGAIRVRRVDLERWLTGLEDLGA
jgi:predicted DNA-binding transcriptional regulator AlpA